VLPAVFIINMKLNLISTKEILDFEKEIGFELIVNEREINSSSPARLSKYYVNFEHAEVMEGGCLVGKHGNGNTIDEAIRDYCREVSNCKVAFGAYTSEGKEIQFPKLVHSKLLGQ
jgi:hypothetical protein